MKKRWIWILIAIVLIAGIAYAVAGRSDMQKPLQAMYIPD